jgi:hypothetical protein
MPGSAELSSHVASDGLKKPLMAMVKASQCSMEIPRPDLGLRNFADGVELDTAKRLRPVNTIRAMHEIIYLIGLVVVVMFILGLIGVR